MLQKHISVQFQTFFRQWLFCLSPVFTLLTAAAQPVINSFAPGSGPIGTQVVITGNNFGATVASNTVYFGAVKGTVTAASPTSITAVVPAGFSHEPLSVTAAGRTAFSARPFTVTFEGGGSGFSGASFAPKIDFPLLSFPEKGCTADFDGDGRPDLASPNYYDSKVSVLRNTGANGDIGFAAAVNFPTAPWPGCVGTGDFDGDTKPDLVAVGTSVSVFRNTGAPGNISFGPKLDFSAGSEPSFVKAADFDNDGLVDIVVANYVSNTVSVFRNISSGNGNIAFAPKQDYATGANPNHVATGDINGDNLADIVVSNGDFGSTTISILKNVSNGQGNIGFAPKTDLTCTSFPTSVAIGDLDMDGRPDLAVTGRNYNVVSVFRNTGTVGGGIGFAARADYGTAFYPNLVAIGDLDGDGRPDMAVANNGSNSLSVFRNTTSAGGAIDFAPRVNYATGEEPYWLLCADYNMDGKPDMAAINLVDVTFSLYRNKVGDVNKVTLCANADSVKLVGDLIGSGYQWQVNTGGGYTDISDNANYTGTSTAALTIRGFNSGWYGYRYRCTTGGSSSTPFQLQFVSTWTGAGGNQWENPSNWSCGAVPDGNTDVLVNGGSVLVNSNALCRTIKTATGTSVTVTAGNSLNVAK